MGRILGKTLVLLNLIASVVMGVVGFAVYAHRIPWGSSGSGADAVKGVVAVKKQEYDELIKQIGDAYVRCEDARGKLIALEQTRADNLKWYREKLNDLRVGDKEVRSIKYVDGKIAEEADGRPILEDQHKNSQLGSLRGLQSVEQTRAETEQKIDTAQKKITDLIERQKSLTLEMNGEPDKFLGLRALLLEEVTVAKNALAEAEYLKPLRVNRQAEADLLGKRNRALEARVAELAK